MNGTFVVTRTSSTDGDYVSLGIVDQVSGAHFFRAKMSFEDFAKALMAQASPCEFDLRVSIPRLG